MNQLVPLSASAVPAIVTAAGERASVRFLEFFAANIRNPHTRWAYSRAVDDFLAGVRPRACRRSPPSSRSTLRRGKSP
jgi:hypothetical protein